MRQTTTTQNHTQKKALRLLILANPTSGRRRRWKPLNDAVEQLRDAGFLVEFFAEREAIVERMNEVDREEIYCVAAAGGDGTVQWLLDRRYDVRHAVFPLGSENLLARSWNIPSQPSPWCEMIRCGRTRQFDLAELNGKRFALMASAGFDADVVRRVHRRRRGHVTRFDYAKAALNSLRRFEFCGIDVVVDGDARFRAHQVFVFNQPAYALNLPFGKPAEVDDGLLDVVMFERLSRWELVRFAVGTITGIGWLMPKRITVRGERVELSSSARLPIQADGDPAGELPASISIVPQALTLIVP